MDDSIQSPAFETARHLQARYGGADPAPAAAAWSDALALLLAHRTTRKYLPDPLPEGTLEAIVAAAQSAPTSSNLQLWSVVAVEDAGHRARLAALAPGNRHIEQAPLFLVFAADLARARSITTDAGTDGGALDHFEAFLLAAIDASLAAQNAVIAIASLGLGSCYIGGMRNYPDEVAAELALPQETVAMFGLTVGYPDPTAGTETKPRLPQDVVLHREHYGAAAPRARLAAYDEALRQFQVRQSMPPVGWTEQVAKRLGPVSALNGRDTLAATLRGRGFKLR